MSRNSRQRGTQQSLIGPLLQLLKKRKSIVRAKALESLAKMDDPIVVSTVIKALSDASPLVRWTAAQCLGTLRRKEAIDPLVSKLFDRSTEVRMRAAESLGILMSGQRSPDALLQKLRDSNELVRVQAAESLGAIGDRRALSELWRAIHDRSPLVRSYVAAAIASLGSKKDVAKLEETVRVERSDTSKVGFYHALYRLGKHKVLSDLLKLLESKDYRVRCATANTLSEVADRSNSRIIVRALHGVLRKEPTGAARTSIEANLRNIRQKLQ